MYRVDFLGITMGYARFLYKGKVSIGGKTAYHLNVRAWTSGVLSFIYPINETIDYYLDAETIAPIRHRVHGQEKEEGRRGDLRPGEREDRLPVPDNGEIRKKVDVVPSIHDPVSVAYYFRWRDMGSRGQAEERVRRPQGLPDRHRVRGVRNG